MSWRRREPDVLNGRAEQEQPGKTNCLLHIIDGTAL